jgi:hypothetical protein
MRNRTRQKRKVATSNLHPVGFDEGGGRLGGVWDRQARGGDRHTVGLGGAVGTAVGAAVGAADDDDDDESTDDGVGDAEEGVADADEVGMGSGSGMMGDKHTWGGGPISVVGGLLSQPTASTAAAEARKVRRRARMISRTRPSRSSVSPIPTP